MRSSRMLQRKVKSLRNVSASSLFPAVRKLPPLEETLLNIVFVNHHHYFWNIFWGDLYCFLLFPSSYILDKLNIFTRPIFWPLALTTAYITICLGWILFAQVCPRCFEVFLLHCRGTRGITALILLIRSIDKFSWGHNTSSFDCTSKKQTFGTSRDEFKSMRTPGDITGIGQVSKEVFFFFYRETCHHEYDVP